MGKIVMSLAMIGMLAGTAFVFAAPILVTFDHVAPAAQTGLCLSRGLGCGG